MTPGEVYELEAGLEWRRRRDMAALAYAFTTLINQIRPMVWSERYDPVEFGMLKDIMAHYRPEGD